MVNGTEVTGLGANDGTGANGGTGAASTEITATMPLWDFSLAIYAREGVAATLIEWQDKWHIDVNVMLWICWQWQGREIAATETDIAAAQRAVADWREAVVEPLRELRRRIKRDPGLSAYPAAEQARASVLHAELQAEKVVQAVLQDLSLSNSVTKRSTEFSSAIASYLELQGVLPSIAQHAVGPFVRLLNISPRRRC